MAHRGIAHRPGNNASEWYLVPGWLPSRSVIGGWLGGGCYFVRMSFPVLVMRKTYSLSLVHDDHLTGPLHESPWS